MRQVLDLDALEKGVVVSVERDVWFANQASVRAVFAPEVVFIVKREASRLRGCPRGEKVVIDD